MNKYPQYLIIILFFQQLFTTSVLDKPQTQAVTYSEIISLKDSLAGKIKIELTKQEYLLKIKYELSDNQIQSVYLNKKAILPISIKKRGIIVTNYFKIPKADVKEGANLFEINFLDTPPRDIDFRIRNYQKILFDAIYIYFDDSLILKELNLGKDFNNFIIFTLFFFFAFYLFNKIITLSKNQLFYYLIWMSPFMLIFLSFRTFSLMSKFNIFVTPFLFWVIAISNFCVSIFFIGIKNISNIKFIKRRQLLKNNLFLFILVIFGLAVSFIFGEIFSRLYIHIYITKPTIFKKSDKFISYSLKPNFRGNFAGAYVTTNSYGFRGQEINLNKEPEIFRIFCLGDSITFGYGVDDNSPFPVQLEKLLNNREPKKYEVINGAVSGYNAVQERILLEKIGIKFQPDFIIIGFCSNDIPGGLHIPTVLGTLLDIDSEPYRLEDMSFLTRIEYYLVRHSYFYQYLLLKFQALMTKYNWHKKEIMGSYPKDVIDYFSGNPNSDIKKREEIFKQELLRIKNLADKNKIKILLVSFPTKIHLERVDLRMVQKMLKNFCEWHGIYYFDSIPLFSNLKREEIFIDQDHLSSYGHRLIADEIYNLLKRNIVK